MTPWVYDDFNYGAGDGGPGAMFAAQVQEYRSWSGKFAGHFMARVLLHGPAWLHPLLTSVIFTDLVFSGVLLSLTEQTRQQFFTGVMVVFGVVVPVLFVITYILRKYNVRIVNLAVEQEKRRSSVFQAETGKLYENIYEIDITHNRAASEATEVYFESLGVPRSTPYNEALRIIARKHIKNRISPELSRYVQPGQYLAGLSGGQGMPAL